MALKTCFRRLFFAFVWMLFQQPWRFEVTFEHQCWLGPLSKELRSQSKINKINYLSLFKILAFQVRQPSSIKSLQVVGISLEYFWAVGNCLWKLIQLDLRLSSIKSKNFKELLRSASLLFLNEINSFLVETNSPAVISFLEGFISLVFSTDCAGEFLLFAEFPFFFFLVLEVQKFNFEV